jgi:hypothetical protein
MKELLNSLQTKCKGLKAHEFVSVQVADMQQILFAIEKLQHDRDKFKAMLNEQYGKAEVPFVQLFGRMVRPDGNGFIPVEKVGQREPSAFIRTEPVEFICSGPGECVVCDGNCVGVSLEPCEFKTQAVYSVGRGEKDE